MPDAKITSLQNLTAADPANDMLPIVDVSDNSITATGTTKRISINNILACSPSATLASATISGDLTVDTNTLKVDSSNNRVGVGTASPLGPFHLVTTAAGFSEAGYFENSQAVGANVGPRVSLLGAGSVAMSLIQSGWNAAANTDAYLAFLTRGSGGVTERYRIASDGVATWSNVGGGSGTAMTLNSTGLLVGASASGAGEKFNALGTIVSSGQSIGSFGFNVGGFDFNSTTKNLRIYAGTSNATGSSISFVTGTSSSFVTAATIDASGNLLVGTTSAAGVRLDVQTTTGNCIGRVKSNAAASTASFIIDYVETLGCTYIKKAGSDVWIYGVQNDTSATPTFKINTASNVGVQLVAGATAWTTLSDETVKDIIEPIGNAIAKVGSLRSVIGKFKTDSEGTRRSFLIAQDVKSVLPEAVDVVGENNELGLRYTEVIPLLVAAIKELTAEVNALKNA